MWSGSGSNKFSGGGLGRDFNFFLNSLLRRVRPFCHCWCPAISAGHAEFLFICLPGFYLLLSPRFGACTAGVRPFPLAMQHFDSFVSHVISFLLSPRFGACTAGVCPFLFICFPCEFFTFFGHCVRLVSFLSPFVSPSCWSLCPSCLPCVSFCLSSCWSLCPPRPCNCLPWSLVMSPFLWVTAAGLVSLLFPFVCLLVSLLVGHCVRLVSLLSPFVSGLVSLNSCCVRLVPVSFCFPSCLRRAQQPRSGRGDRHSSSELGDKRKGLQRTARQRCS